MLTSLGRWLVPTVMLGSAVSIVVSARSLATNGTKQGYCVIENGFDIRGNDLYEVAGSSADVCCDECSKHYACSSWTWTNHNGGTCWLKGGRTWLEVNPNAKSALMFDAPPPVASSPTAEGCCEICQKTLGCRVYSWNNVNGGTCWFKNNRVDAVVRKGVKSAYTYPHYGYDDVCPVAIDVDFEGNDIGKAASPTATGCCVECRVTPNCRAYSWTNQDGGTCYLKSLKGNTVPKAGVSSAVLYPNPTYTCAAQDGVDYPGNDIGSVRSFDPTFCCSISSEYEGCKAYTWTDFNSGTCWLKSAKSTPVPAPGAKSGCVA